MTDLTLHYYRLIGMAKNWAIAHLPHFNDENHRDLLQRYGAKPIDGKISAKTLSFKALGEVLNDYERRGWVRLKTFGKAGSAKVIPADIKMIFRLWGKLGQAGKVTNATRPALMAFVERQTGRAVKSLDDLEVTKRQAIIEALKAWMKR